VTEPVLDIRRLSTYFRKGDGRLKAIDQFSMQVFPGEVVALVGESGCGKSVAALSVMRLLPETMTEYASEGVLFQGVDLLKLGDQDMRALRGNRIAMIFQDPMTSLNPVLTVGEQISEILVRHQGLRRRKALAVAQQMLERVYIPEPRLRLTEYPHQLSGGMRQRVMIAMALCCHPRLLIADEPTTALDVTTQAQIIELLNDLRRDFEMAVIFITHDLGVVAEIADRVAVMYAGRKVEEGEVHEFFAQPAHPYTRGLMRAMPNLAQWADTGLPEALHEIPGMVPDIAARPAGCAFHNRCGFSTPRCESAMPALTPITGQHVVACWAHPIAVGGGDAWPQR